MYMTLLSSIVSYKLVYSFVEIQMSLSYRIPIVNNDFNTINIQLVLKYIIKKKY